jgi:hypothetical protein
LALSLVERSSPRQMREGRRLVQRANRDELSGATEEPPAGAGLGAVSLWLWYRMVKQAICQG